MKSSPVCQECVRPGVTTQFYLTLDGTINDPDAAPSGNDRIVDGVECLVRRRIRRISAAQGFADVENQTRLPDGAGVRYGVSKEKPCIRHV